MLSASSAFFCLATRTLTVWAGMPVTQWAGTSTMLGLSTTPPQRSSSRGEMTTTLTSQGKAWVGAARLAGSSSLPPTIPVLFELNSVNLKNQIQHRIIYFSILSVIIPLSTLNAVLTADPNIITSEEQR